MSKIIGSNRILKSPYVVFDKNNAVPIDNEVFIPTRPAFTEDDLNVFDSPGDILMQDLREEGELPEQELAGKIIERAKAEADRIIQSAKEDADLILDRMETEAQDAIKELEEKVTERAYAEGYDKGMAEAEAIKEDARTFYANAVRERQESVESLEQDVIELIIEILNKLLTDSININPQVILYLIRKGFTEAKLSGDVTIRVSDEDYEEAHANMDTFVQYADAGAKVDIIKDFSLNKADCIIETPFGMIDCSLDQQYDALRKNLYYIFENR